MANPEKLAQPSTLENWEGMAITQEYSSQPSQEDSIKPSQEIMDSWNQPTKPQCSRLLTRLQSRRLTFVWNLIDEAEASIWKRGEQPTTNQRHRLAIALSEDDGRLRTLPVIAAQAKEISYPFLLEVAPGQLMISSGRLREPDLEMDTVVLLTSETTLLKLAKEMAGQKAQ